jgi:hypothetical protein
MRDFFASAVVTFSKQLLDSVHLGHVFSRAYDITEKRHQRHVERLPRAFDDGTKGAATVALMADIRQSVPFMNVGILGKKKDHLQR